MAIRKILLLGNPHLYEVCDPVLPQERASLLTVVGDLHDTLMDFRRRYAAGRAIAAPQIGVKKRLVYMCIDTPIVFFNPVLDLLSDETFELWDDCMSFPDLLVKVRRHVRCRVSYRDDRWEDRQMVLEGALSELLQHECDHLDGILAVQRALDGKSFMVRSEPA